MKNFKQTEIVRIPMTAVLMALCLTVSACGDKKSDDDQDTDAGIVVADAGTGDLDGGSTAGDAGPDDAGFTGEPCGTVPIEGVCRGNVARYCAGDSIWEHDCAKDGEVCVQDELGAICGPGGGDSDGGTDDDGGLTDVCKGISEEGICDRTNNAAIICQGGVELITLECTPLNATCDYDDVTGHAVCADKRGCGTVGEEGVCRGSMSVYCWDDVLYYEECGDVTGCGWSIEFGNYCMYDELTPLDCRNIPAAGQCDGEGTLLRYCENNTPHVVNCITEGFDGCGLDSSSGKYACVNNQTPPPPVPCGSVTSYGECSSDGSSVIFCNENDSLATIPCTGGKCEKASGFADCVYDWMGQECGSIDEKGVCEGHVAKYCLFDELTGETCEGACEYDDDGYAVCP